MARSQIARSNSLAIVGKDQKGYPQKGGIHDQGDFYKNLLETTV